MRNVHHNICVLLALFTAVCLTNAFAGKPKAMQPLTAAAPPQSVTLSVHDAAGRIYQVTATRIEPPPFAWSADGQHIDLAIQTDRLSCSGFGER